MLRSYRDTIEIVELDLNTTVGRQVDITLYDTFGGTRTNREEVALLAANGLAGKVVIYSWSLDPALVAEALAAGASAYLSKGLTARELAAALHAVHRGEPQPPPERAGSTTVIGGDWPGREEGLTQREAEVLALITQGLSNIQIAESANLSINSVKTYIRNCYRRIGVTDRSNAILWGVKHGFRPDRKRILPADVGSEVQ